MGFVNDNLLDYIEQNSEPIGKSIAIEGATLDRVRIMPNVKGSATINLISTDAAFQAGKGCGFNPNGDVTLSQRVVETAIVKKEFALCDDDLIGTYAEKQVRVSADGDGVPFEEEIMRDIINGVAEDRELLMWQGDKDSSKEELKFIDGYLKIAKTEASVIDVEIASGTSVYDALKKVKNAIPAKLKRKDVRLNISPELFGQFIDELVEKNYYHYTGPQDAAPQEYTFPGTRYKVVETPGLMGTPYIFASTDDNLVYATDVASDEGKNLLVNYDKMKEQTEFKVKFNMGVQIAIPEFVVLGTIAQ